jgi:hypothetical protein
LPVSCLDASRRVPVRRRAGLAGFLPISPLLAAGAELAAALHISETVGVAQHAAPVTTGLPLPRGGVTYASHVWRA